MAEVQQTPMLQSTHGRHIPERTGSVMIPSSVQSRNAAQQFRSSLLNMGTFSPVNENGSFEFDRVLKSGYVQKRTRRTKAWKTIYLVLRPQSLSIYKDQNEVRLRHKIQLSDLTVVALLKDPKHKRDHVFGLFSPSRNYHIEAATLKDAQEWVNLIRGEARIEEEEEELYLASPGANVTTGSTAFGQASGQRDEALRLREDRLGSSSPEPVDPMPMAQRGRGSKIVDQPRPSRTMEYSGNEISDISDGDMMKATAQPPAQPILQGHNASRKSVNVVQDPERVVWQGYLLYLKTSAGVRQWKDLWVVIRPRHVAFYKDDLEYAPLRIIPLSSIINVVEIDPLSKTKIYCLQIITDEKSYKLCAHNEKMLDQSLGSLKCLLAKRRDNH